ncbi:ATP-binding protein [uncultured Methanobrevibacter sp.]|uniref:ATP-binding protein n=1 Tax=uncultured Methanobrevibacter sp. TaxID=253161 RepID=UPI0025DF3C8E|nr:ATP-binding protein [uncultured Methanobrevibacter sp.]
MENEIQTIKEIKKKIKDFEKSDIDKTKTKKLKFYEFNDFLNVSEKIEEYLSDFTDEIEKLLPSDVDKQSINFLLYELLINVYKHSKFRNAHIEINNDENITILIHDDGIGIPKSFKDAKIKCSNDGKAIFYAVNGKTTDKEKFNLHGRGLNSTARITTLGFEGKMIISSGNGTCKITKNGINIIQNKTFIDGTFILLRINNKKIDNLYEYLKFEKINEEVEHD